MARLSRGPRWAVLFATAALAGCAGGLDLDVRDRLSGAFDTSGAVDGTAPRPQPDARGLITYPTYQVAVARRGDTARMVADRVGVGAEQLARFNGVDPDAVLNADAVLVMPRRVPAAGQRDIAGIAGAAIDRSGPTATPGPGAPAGPEPVRHKVARGETAFSIARLYGVSVRSLADWNGLGPDLSVREGQFLLIPLATAQPAPAPQPAATAPGQGTATPLPPSASAGRPCAARS